MELLITLGIIGGIFVLGVLILGLMELGVYIVAGVQAFPVKVAAVYTKMVENNKEFLAKREAAKIEREQRKLDAKKEKLNKKAETVVPAETTKVEEVVVPDNKPVDVNVAG